MSRSTAKAQSPAQSAYVLDSFAFLVWLRDENGAERVQAVLERADRKEIKLHASWVNVAEVYYITKRRSLDSDPDLTAAEALAAARLKAVFPISIADAFAAALAKSNNAKIITGDPEFKALERAKELAIEWLPQKA
jgi:ribonuclease VapC